MSWSSRLRRLVIPAVWTIFGVTVGIIASKIHKIRQRGKARSVNEFLEDRELTWKAFVEQSRSFFDVNWGCPMFQLIEILDQMYRTAYARAPFPKGKKLWRWNDRDVAEGRKLKALRKRGPSTKP